MSQRRGQGHSLLRTARHGLRAPHLCPSHAGRPAASSHGPRHGFRDSLAATPRVPSHSLWDVHLLPPPSPACGERSSGVQPPHAPVPADPTLAVCSVRRGSPKAELSRSLLYNEGRARGLQHRPAQGVRQPRLQSPQPTGDSSQRNVWRQDSTAGATVTGDAQRGRGHHTARIPPGDSWGGCLKEVLGVTPGHVSYIPQLELNTKPRASYGPRK